MQNDPLTPCQDFGGFWAKREDFGGYMGPEYPSGAKWRQYLAMAAAQPGAAMLVGCSADSAMQVYVAAAAKVCGVPGIIYTAARKERTAATLYAIAQGAEVNEVRPGYLSVCRNQASARAAVESGPVVKWNPAGATADTAAQCANIPAGVRRIVVPVGTGAILAGILQGCDLPVLAVRVSPMAALKETARLQVVDCWAKYDRPIFASLPDGARLDPFYAAKAAAYLWPGDLLWVSGVRPAAAFPGGM